MVLLAYGVGLTLGNVIGGRLADWRTLPSIIGLFTALMAVLVVFTVTSHFQVGAIVTMVVWGAVSFALVAPLQMRVVDAASEAPNLASTLNQGAFNIGCASGAFVGGIPIGLGLSYDGLPFVGAAVALVGLGLALIARQLDQRRAAAVAAC
jgi:DHA1 family inner membrane transport protein